jgi:hypothetical protein
VGDDPLLVAQAVCDVHEQGDSSDIDESKLGEVDVDLGALAYDPTQRLFPVIVAVQIYLTGDQETDLVACAIDDLQWSDRIVLIGDRCARIRHRWRMRLAGLAVRRFRRHDTSQWVTTNR